MPPLEIILSHENTLAEARNLGAAKATGDWLVFLDADDALDSKYIEAMSRRIDEVGGGDYLIQPATLGVVDGVDDDFAVLIPARTDISSGNWMVIGTAVRRDTFVRVGGFMDLPCWEDWVLWTMCIISGSKCTTSPEAIYRVTVTANSRNNPSPSDVAYVMASYKGMFANADTRTDGYTE